MHDPVDQGAPIPAADRQAAMRAAARRCINVRRLRAADLAVLILPAIGAVLVGLALNRALIAAGFSPSGVAFGFASGVLYVGFGAFVYRRRYTRLVFEELRARGHDVCPKCGYFRADIPRDAPCPECGTPSAPV